MGRNISFVQCLPAQRNNVVKAELSSWGMMQASHFPPNSPRSCAVEPVWFLQHPCSAALYLIVVKATSNMFQGVPRNSPHLETLAPFFLGGGVICSKILDVEVSATQL